MSNIFQKRKLVNFMSQAANLGRLPCRSKYESQRNNHEVKNCGKNCLSCPYLLKTSLHQFKRVSKFFLLKNSFIYESYVFICQGCKEEYIGESGCLVKERISIYRQLIRQLQYQQLAVEEDLCTCGDGKFHLFPFFNICQENE